jgi:antirestriction protein ArdC
MGRWYEMTSKQNAYEIVAQNIINALESGDEVAPWRKPWLAVGYKPKSLSSRKTYNGTNALLLTFSAMSNDYKSPWWGTYKQILELGGIVRKGEKGTPVVLYKQLEKETETGETKKFPIMRYFTVFSAEQADWEAGAPEYETIAERDSIEINAHAERIISGYLGRETLTFTEGGDRAYYSPSKDLVNLPLRGHFTGDDEYYSTYFHELAHSTGHESRLNREGVIEGHAFGSELYSEEELVAELTAAFLSGETGILPSTVNNSTAYIKSWLTALKSDPKMLVKAAGRAYKAAHYISEGKVEGE